MFAIDTRTGSYPHAYLLNKGIELFNQGYDAEEIVKQIEEMKTNTRLFLIPSNLDQLHKSGRVSGSQRFIANLLNIKPILSVEYEGAKIREKVRTEKRAINYILELLREDMKTSKISKIVVIHADDEANARTLLNGHGITYKDLSVDYLVYAEAADGLSAGTIDAAFLTNGLPNASVMELSETLDICLVSISPENAEGIISSNFKKRRKTPFFYSGKMVFLSFVPSSLPLFHFLTEEIIF